MKNQGFEICFYRKRQELEDLENIIIDMIKNDPSVTITRLAETSGKSSRSIQSKLNKLKKDGIIKRIGSNKTGYWKVID